MKRARRMLAGATALVMTAGAAAAADMPMMVAPTAPPPVIAPAPTFNWAGTYAGGYVGQIAAPLAVGGHFGFNRVNGRVVFGGEVGLGVIPAGPVLTLSTRGRVGVTLGQRALLYGAAGIELIFVGFPPQPLFSVTGGLEYAVGDRISVFGEVGLFGAIVPFGCCGFPAYRVGVNFHLGQ